MIAILSSQASTALTELRLKCEVRFYYEHRRGGTLTSGEPFTIYEDGDEDKLNDVTLTAFRIIGGCSDSLAQVAASRVRP